MSDNNLFSIFPESEPQVVQPIVPVKRKYNKQSFGISQNLELFSPRPKRNASAIANLVISDMSKKNWATSSVTSSSSSSKFVKSKVKKFGKTISRISSMETKSGTSQLESVRSIESSPDIFAETVISDVVIPETDVISGCSKEEKLENLVVQVTETTSHIVISETDAFKGFDNKEKHENLFVPETEASSLLIIPETDAVSGFDKEENGNLIASETQSNVISPEPEILLHKTPSQASTVIEDTEVIQETNIIVPLIQQLIEESNSDVHRSQQNVASDFDIALTNSDFKTVSTESNGMVSYKNIADNISEVTPVIDIAEENQRILEGTDLEALRQSLFGSVQERLVEMMQLPDDVDANNFDELFKLSFTRPELTLAICARMKELEDAIASSPIELKPDNSKIEHKDIDRCDKEENGNLIASETQTNVISPEPEILLLSTPSQTSTVIEETEIIQETNVIVPLTQQLIEGSNSDVLRSQQNVASTSDFDIVLTNSDFKTVSTESNAMVSEKNIADNISEVKPVIDIAEENQRIPQGTDLEALRESLFGRVQERSGEMMQLPDDVDANNFDELFKLSFTRPELTLAICARMKELEDAIASSPIELKPDNSEIEYKDIDDEMRKKIDLDLRRQFEVLRTKYGWDKELKQQSTSESVVWYDSD